ncbi:MAG: sulfatase-like hydrolase/transferase [Acidobacteria bacterium]|nr:sulfatase-like hydrolase/transferase [Acidobacteriota bacterium]MCI0717766.1 sulfatase-like hydrolase/transferase [Acidobacteriota bacterium]
MGCQFSKTVNPEAQKQSVQLSPISVLLITLDTLRPDRLGCYGSKLVQTPNLDRLGVEGVVFENAVTQVPLTPPAHASMMTGLDPLVHKVRDTGGFVLEDSFLTLAEILREQGWKTAAFVGASVLGKQFGLNQGFEVYDDQMTKPEPGMAAPEYPERRAAVVVDRALEWFAGNRQSPVFLWVHLYDPHAPYDPPAKFKKRYRGRPYDGEVAYTDQEVGRLIERVRKALSPAQLLVAVLADHGESLSEHGEYSHGVFIYDSTLRIPFILSGPGVPSGVRVKSQARTTDLLPTLLELLGGNPAQPCQGTSLVPAFNGKPVATLPAYIETLHPKISMGWAELRGIRTNKWKYIRAPRPELYDLESDPSERRNVIDKFESEAEDLGRKLTALLPGGPNAAHEEIQFRVIGNKTEEQLRSLGYVSTGRPRKLALTGQGADPKDRVHILRLVEEAIRPGVKISPSSRLGLLKRANQEDPENPSIVLALGDMYEKGRFYSEALALYLEAIKRDIPSAKLHTRTGNIYLRQGKKQEAIFAFETAIALNPTDLDAQSNLATAYLEKGLVPQAERIFKGILVLNEQYAAAHNGLAVVSVQRGDARAARQHFERAAELDPDLVEVHLNLGVLYREAGDVALARRSFEKFVSKAPKHQYGELIRKVKKELASLD